VKGYLLAIEGIDAIGKNTHTALLSDWLVARGIRTARMSFPDYGTPIGAEIKSFLSGRRDYPVEVQHMLFAANRWERLDAIQSHLREGEVLIIDRYTPSNMAYGSANGLDVAWLANLERGLPRADLVLVLDAPPSALRSRRSSKDSYEKSSKLQSKAQKAYRELSPKKGWKVINADGPIAQVQEAVLTALRRELKSARGVSI